MRLTGGRNGQALQMHKQMSTYSDNLFVWIIADIHLGVLLNNLLTEDDSLVVISQYLSFNMLGYSP